MLVPQAAVMTAFKPEGVWGRSPQSHVRPVGADYQDRGACARRMQGVQGRSAPQCFVPIGASPSADTLVDANPIHSDSSTEVALGN